MPRFVFYGDTQGNTENWQLYIWIEKKNFFLLSCKSKCRSPCEGKKISLLRNYPRTNQTNTNKNNDDTDVEEIEHDSLSKLFAYS